MAPDCFQMAAEGWRIITGSDDARQGARHLLRWLAEAFNLSAAELSFRSGTDSYRWQERVGRVVPGIEHTHTWTRPFPTGLSCWTFEGDTRKLVSRESLLDLLAEQWLSMAIENRNHFVAASNKSRYNRVSCIIGWTALSRSSRIIRSRIPALALSRKPLLMVGEEGSGRNHLAVLLHAHGPDPSAFFSEADAPGKERQTGTLFVPDWRLETEEKKKGYLKAGARLIVSSTPGDRGEDLQAEWLELTDGEGSSLSVPPLRERKEDIPSLAGTFIEEFSAPLNAGSPDISQGALDALLTYNWPGNIAELKEALLQTLKNLPISGNRISIRHLPPQIRGALATEESFPERLEALEYEALREELSRQRGNMTRTAKALGLTPRQVGWRVRKYGLNPRDFKPHLQMEN